MIQGHLLWGGVFIKKGPKIQNLLFALSAFGRQHSHRHAYLFLREFNAAYQFLSFFSILYSTMATIDRLPKEVLLQIFGYADKESLKHGIRIY